MKNLSRKWKISILLITLFVGALFLLQSIYASLKQNPFIRMPPLPWENIFNGYTDKTLKIEIAGRVFDIPAIYFDTKPAAGGYKESLLLEVIWPEMQSTHHLPDKDAYREMRESKKIGWILIEPAAKRPSLDEQVNRLRSTLIKEDPKGKRGILEEYYWYRGTKNNPKLYYQVFLRKNDDGKITDYIECWVKGPYPICKHKFIHNGLIYDLSYNMRNFLEEWENQRKRTIELMSKFESNHNQRSVN